MTPSNFSFENSAIRRNNQVQSLAYNAKTANAGPTNQSIFASNPFDRHIDIGGDELYLAGNVNVGLNGSILNGVSQEASKAEERPTTRRLGDYYAPIPEPRLANLSSPIVNEYEIKERSAFQQAGGVFYQNITAPKGSSWKTSKNYERHTRECTPAECNVPCFINYTKDGKTYKVNYDKRGNTTGVIVQGGETVREIAIAYGVTAKDLIAANKDKIKGSEQNAYFYKGTEIVIPRIVPANEFVGTQLDREAAAKGDDVYTIKNATVPGCNYEPKEFPCVVEVKYENEDYVVRYNRNGYPIIEISSGDTWSDIVTNYKLTEAEKEEILAINESKYKLMLDKNQKKKVPSFFKGTKIILPKKMKIEELVKIQKKRNLARDKREDNYRVVRVTLDGINANNIEKACTPTTFPVKLAVKKDNKTYYVRYNAQGYTEGVVVQNGDGILKLASKFKVSPYDLIKANQEKVRGVAPNRYFLAGAMIVIPRTIPANEFHELTKDNKNSYVAEHEYFTSVKNPARKMAGIMYKTLDEHCAGVTEKAFKEQLAKVDASNVVELLNEYSKKSPDESLIEAIMDETGNYLSDRKAAVRKIVNALSERAAKLKINDDRINQALNACKKEIDSYWTLGIGYCSTAQLDYEVKLFVKTIELAEGLSEAGRSKGMTENDIEDTIKLMNKIKEDSEKTLQDQLDADGWCADLWEGIKWCSIFSDQLDEKVKADIKKYEGYIDDLQKAAREGFKAGGKEGAQRAFKAKFKEIFGVSFDYKLIKGYMEIQENIGFAMAASMEVDGFKKEFGSYLNNEGLDDYEVMKQKYDEYIRGKAEINGTYLAPVEVTIKEELQKQGIKFENATEEQKQAVLVRIISNDYNALTQKLYDFTKGKSIDEMKKILAESGPAVFGNKHDIMDRVNRYVSSQQAGGQGVAMTIKIGAALALGLMTGGAGFVAISGAALATGGISFVVDSTDRWSSNNGLQDGELKKIAISAAVDGASFFAGGCAGRAATQIATKSAFLNAGGRFLLCGGTDLTTGVAGNYIQTGTIEIEGVLYCAAFSVAGNLTALRPLRKATPEECAMTQQRKNLYASEKTGTPETTATGQPKPQVADNPSAPKTPETPSAPKTPETPAVKPVADATPATHPTGKTGVPISNKGNANLDLLNQNRAGLDVGLSVDKQNNIKIGSQKLEVKVDNGRLTLSQNGFSKDAKGRWVFARENNIQETVSIKSQNGQMQVEIKGNGNSTLVDINTKTQPPTFEYDGVTYELTLKKNSIVSIKPKSCKVTEGDTTYQREISIKAKAKEVTVEYTDTIVGTKEKIVTTVNYKPDKNGVMQVEKTETTFAGGKFTKEVRNGETVFDIDEISSFKAPSAGYERQMAKLQERYLSEPDIAKQKQIAYEMQSIVNAEKALGNNVKYTPTIMKKGQIKEIVEIDGQGNFERIIDKEGRVVRVEHNGRSIDYNYDGYFYNKARRNRTIIAFNKGTPDELIMEEAGQLYKYSKIEKGWKGATYIKDKEGYYHPVKELRNATNETLNKLGIKRADLDRIGKLYKKDATGKVFDPTKKGDKRLAAAQEKLIAPIGKDGYRTPIDETAHATKVTSLNTELKMNKGMQPSLEQWQTAFNKISKDLDIQDKAVVAFVIEKKTGKIVSMGLNGEKQANTGFQDALRGVMPPNANVYGYHCAEMNAFSRLGNKLKPGKYECISFEVKRDGATFKLTPDPSCEGCTQVLQLHGVDECTYLFDKQVLK